MFARKMDEVSFFTVRNHQRAERGKEEKEELSDKRINASESGKCHMLVISLSR